MTRSSLCPCHSGRTLGRCCGPFEHLPDPRPTTDPSAIHRSFRNHLIALIRDAESLSEIWVSFLEHWIGEGDPDSIEVDSGLLDHFLWDWFQRYPEARPICRVVQALESVDLPMSSQIGAWTDSPLEPWEVVEAKAPLVGLRRLNGSKEIQALMGFPMARLKKGDALLGRILPHRGLRVLGLGACRLPGPKGVAHLQAMHARAMAARGLAPSVTLRPDVHSGIWLPLHDDLVRAARGLPQPVAKLSIETSVRQEMSLDLDAPRGELGGQSAREAAAHELGRLRLRKWAATLSPSERTTLEHLLR
ncbi:MAG TPA: SEC-C metal-binding domain-containing protein [Fibrobacteria bacterium]|nr:SEC-C metal-binding domain-containing protein [Fibrobacteria bacterium]